MNSTSLFLAGLSLATAGLLLDLPATLAADPTPASLPSMTEAFGPKTTLALYLDFGAARSSPVWKALADQAPAMRAALQKAAPPNLPNLDRLSQVPDLPWDDLAQVALAVRGQDALGNLTKDRVDPDFGFLVLVRFSKAITPDDLLKGWLEAAEKEKPGTREALEKSRRTVGGAEVFTVPAALLEAQRKLPFEVAFAVQTVSDATLLGLGRAEMLSEYLQRKLSDTLSDRIERQVAGGTQFWLFAPVPEQKTTGATADLMRSNPMIGAMAKGFSQVRELTLGLHFGEGGLDLALLLGCKDAAGAADLNGSLQGMLGFIQAAGAQGPNPAMPASVQLLRTLKTAQDGTSVRFSASFTLEDIQKAMAGSDGGARGRAGPSRAPKLPQALESDAAPVALEFLGLLPGEDESVRWGSVRLVNQGPTPVEAVRVTFVYTDDQGRKVGEWTRRLTGETDTLLGAQATRTLRTGVFFMPVSATKVVLQLQEVELAGGGRWPARR